MKYLILSDIHSNHEALSAVLSFVQRKPWDKAVFLGDLVGYGANPNQTVDMVRELRPLAAIRGNHDKVCSGIEEGELFNRMALEAAMWTRRKLTPVEPELAARPARGPGGGGRHLRHLPRHAARRGRLHLRRDRGAERVPADELSRLLLRPLALPRDLRPLHRRHHHRAHGRRLVPLQAAPGRALPDQPGLGGPAARRQPARSFASTTPRSRSSPSTASRTAWRKRSRRSSTPASPGPSPTASPSAASSRPGPAGGAAAGAAGRARSDSP